MCVFFCCSLFLSLSLPSCVIRRKKTQSSSLFESNEENRKRNEKKIGWKRKIINKKKTKNEQRLWMNCVRDMKSYSCTNSLLDFLFIRQQRQPWSKCAKELNHHPTDGKSLPVRCDLKRSIACLGIWSNPPWMISKGRCVKLNSLRTKENAKWKLSGPYSRFITRKRATYSICTTSVRPSARSCTITVWRTPLPIKISSVSERRDELSTSLQPRWRFLLCSSPMEEARLRESLLSSMYSTAWYQF